MDARTETKWVELAKAGDRKAFDRLIEDAWPRVLAVTMAATDRNTTLAKEAAQQACVVAYLRIAQFEGRGRFYAWVSMIARREARDLVVAATRFDEEDVLAEHAAGEDSPEAVAMANEEAAIDRRKLAAAGAVAREVYRLRVEDGLSHDEIEDLTGLSSAEVKRALKAAARELAAP